MGRDGISGPAARARRPRCGALAQELGRDPEGIGPNISLGRVPERRTGKRSPFHLDLYTNNPAGEVERLVNLGARCYPWRYPPDADFVVLEDPDGNLSCVAHKEDNEHHCGCEAG